MRRSALQGPVEDVAPRLLGALLTHTTPDGTVTVRLTEVEAYGGVGEDPASHAHRGATRRNASMFSAAGTLYVYFTYGMHWCANVVTGPAGAASAVLLRAGTVVEGLDLAHSRRPTAGSDAALARGPANLTKCLGIDGALDGCDLLDPVAAVRLATGRRVSPARVSSGPRIGIRVALDRPWRWWVQDAPSVSRHRVSRSDAPR
jgi:DNA-3-methyladenine glycosylase